MHLPPSPVQNVTDLRNFREKVFLSDDLQMQNCSVGHRCEEFSQLV